MMNFPKIYIHSLLLFRHSVVKMFEEGSLPLRAPPLKRGMSLDAVGKRNLFKLQQDKTSIDKVEYEQCKLEPKVEDRIIILTDEVSLCFLVCLYIFSCSICVWPILLTNNSELANYSTDKKKIFI